MVVRKVDPIQQIAQRGLYHMVCEYGEMGPYWTLQDPPEWLIDLVEKMPGDHYAEKCRQTAEGLYSIVYPDDPESKQEVAYFFIRQYLSRYD